MCLDRQFPLEFAVLDGVYASRGPFARPVFHPAEPLTDRDVVEVLALLDRRVLSSGA